MAGGLIAALRLFDSMALRLKGDYLAIITLGFGEIIRVVIQNLTITGGPAGLTRIPRMSRTLAENPKESAAIQFAIVYWIMVIVVTSIFTLGRSRHGRAIISIRENEVAAEATGIPTTYYKLLAFTFAAFFAGIAGGLHAHQIGMLTPKYFDFNKSIEYLVMVVLGGMGSNRLHYIRNCACNAARTTPRFCRLAHGNIFPNASINDDFPPSGLMGTKEFSLTATVDELEPMPQVFKRKERKPKLPF